MIETFETSRNKNLKKNYGYNVIEWFGYVSHRFNKVSNYIPRLQEEHEKLQAALGDKDGKDDFDVKIKKEDRDRSDSDRKRERNSRDRDRDRYVDFYFFWKFAKSFLQRRNFSCSKRSRSRDRHRDRSSRKRRSSSKSPNKSLNNKDNNKEMTNAIKLEIDDDILVPDAPQAINIKSKP